MAKYRIIELHGKYIPQKRSWFGTWSGINQGYGLVKEIDEQYLFCGRSDMTFTESIIKSYIEIHKEPKVIASFN